MTQKAEQKQYKATLILDTRHSDKEIDAIIKDIEEGFKACDAKISKTENYGTKEFKRVADRKFPSGVYVEINFEAPTTAPAAVQDRFRLNKVVNRIMIENAA